MVRCRLDRALANEEWHMHFPCSYTEYLKMVGSDHRPVVAFLEDNLSRKKKDNSGLIRDGLDRRVSRNQLWQDKQKIRKEKEWILLQKLIIVVMKYPHGERIINHMGRTKLKIFNRHWKSQPSGVVRNSRGFAFSQSIS